MSTRISTLTLSDECLHELAACGRYGIEYEVPLAPFTSFRIGGPALMLLTVNDLDKLIKALDILNQHEIPFLILGGGSNVLVSDNGVPDVVLLNQCRKMNLLTPEPGLAQVTVESGASLAGFARSVINQGLAGLAWAVSVPGTIGGAVVGNAGAHGGCIADNLYSVRFWSQGTTQVVLASELQLQYRRSRIKSEVAQPAFGPVVLDATFHLRTDPEGEEKASAQRFIEHRRRTQPVDKSAGSIFKNPAGDFAGRLIEAAGLKGAGHGDAGISRQHANFIINHGNASSDDIIELINLVRSTVYSQTGIILEPEIQLLGDWQGRAQVRPLPA